MRAPRHKAARPTLIPAEDLKAAWDLMWLLEPAQAVALVETGRKFLKDPEGTRRWFHEGMGGSSLMFLLNLFWPKRYGSDGSNAMCNHADAPRRTGLKTPAGGMEAVFKRLLKALGRNDWQRAEAMLQASEHHVNSYSMKEQIYSLSMSEDAHGAIRYLVDVGYEYWGIESLFPGGTSLWRVPSVLQLLEIRAAIVDVLRCDRLGRLPDRRFRQVGCGPIFNERAS